LCFVGKIIHPSLQRYACLLSCQQLVNVVNNLRSDSARTVFRSGGRCGAAACCRRTGAYADLSRNAMFGANLCLAASFDNCHQDCLCIRPPPSVHDAQPINRTGCPTPAGTLGSAACWRPFSTTFRYNADEKSACKRPPLQGMIRVNVKFEFMCHFNDVICSALLGWLRSKIKEQVEQQRQRELTERTVVTGKFAVWAAPAAQMTECVQHR